MKATTQRVIIYPKDVRRITGRSERYCRLLIKKIKDDLSKKEHQLITLTEFCIYTGLDPDVIAPFIDD